MQKNVLNELQLNANYLSGVERKIAEEIFADPRRFTGYSLSELSEKIGVSQGSIVNFSNKFVGGGFPTLKLQIAACLSGYQREPFSVVEKTDDVKAVLRKRRENIVWALNQTETVITEAELGEIVEKLLQAKRVEIYGVYRSAVVATDFYYQLLQLGIPVSVVSDALTCAVSASMLEKGSLVFVISASGLTKEMIDAVKVAKGKGIETVCLTANGNAPLAKLCDHVLIAAASGSSVSGKDTEIRFSQMALTDTLCAYAQNKIDADGAKRYFALREILNLHNVND